MSHGESRPLDVAAARSGALAPLKQGMDAHSLKEGILNPSRVHPWRTAEARRQQLGALRECRPGRPGQAHGAVDPDSGRVLRARRQACLLSIPRIPHGADPRQRSHECGAPRRMPQGRERHRLRPRYPPRGRVGRRPGQRGPWTFGGVLSRFARHARTAVLRIRHPLRVRNISPANRQRRAGRDP